ncbi:hypothetical protein [Demequina sp. NBRC 110052]|uniref:hypothetical protein n=1 Tax=Demequina sp. NBRC 110052 TaxID=1570341 RepID=UPI00117F09A0|nr:hypothetical protein [Demequina sp. NBRC 110052]
MRRMFTGAALAAAGVLALAACTPEVPEPVTAGEMELQAAVIQSQADFIIEDTFAELDAADAALDAALLTDRVGGQVKATREAEYKLRKANGEIALTDIPSEMQATYAPGGDDWPRVLVMVTAQPEDDLTPVVLMWVQDSVFADYQLRGWAHMVPGATLPAMPGETTGVTALALDSDAVEPPPQTAIENYLELLRGGPEDEFAGDFGEDTYRDRLFAARDALSKQAKEADGSYVDTFNPSFDSTYAIATAEGGALVFAPLTVSSAFTVKDATVSVPDGDKPLASGEFDDKVTHTYADFLVMHIPPTGSEALPTVVAADHRLVKVSAG